MVRSAGTRAFISCRCLCLLLRELVLANTRRPARSTMTLRRRAEGLGWRDRLFGIAPSAQDIDRVTAPGAEPPRPTELGGSHPASPDPSAQERGGVSAGWRPAATARVGASPFRADGG